MGATMTLEQHYWEMKILKLNAFIGVAVTIPDRMFDVAKCCGDETETSFGWCWDGDTKVRSHLLRRVFGIFLRVLAQQSAGARPCARHRSITMIR